MKEEKNKLIKRFRIYNERKNECRLNNHDEYRVYNSYIYFWAKTTFDIFKLKTELYFWTRD